MNRGLKQRNKRKRKRRVRVNLLIILVSILLLGVVIWKISSYNQEEKVKNLTQIEIPSWIDTQIIEVDGVSRNGKKLNAVKDIVVHYVGNPGSTAQQNHDFYEGSQSSVSSRFIVGLNGEIIQCIPLNECSAASNWRNNDTISIEVCHPDDTGKFRKKTYKSLVKLVAWLEDICDLEEEHVIRHYDITGKECPRYFVQHEDEWTKFKMTVENYRISQNY
jgi:N-acetylmuramoyl-L-alanine amidase CwlA